MSISGLEDEQKMQMVYVIDETSKREEYEKDEGDSDEDNRMLAPVERETHHRGCVFANPLHDDVQSEALRAGVAQEVSGFFDEKDTERLQRLLLNLGDGFALKGWRRKFDPEGALGIPFTKFCKVSVEIGFVKRAAELHARPRDFSSIMLQQVIPELGALMESFRRWISLKYKDHGNFFDALDPEHKNKVSREDFVSSCRLKGFHASETELLELFTCCDQEGHGYIIRDDVVFLEHDAAFKERELMHIKRRKQYEVEKLQSDNYVQELANEVSSHNRQATRPWVARTFEEMPVIQRQVQGMCEKKRVKKGVESRVAFIRHIRRLHGSEVTSWRRVLDSDAKFLVSEGRFRQLCRQLDFKGDMKALWYSLDPDHDGTLSLEQLSPQAAILLASFRQWIVERFGSCIKLWDARIRSMVGKNIGTVDFGQILSKLECPMIQGEKGKTATKFICRSLDVSGGGFICKTDLEWLDKWQPAEWLTVGPDEFAWRQLNDVLVNKFGHILKAWFSELDTDNSNKLSWAEFHDACERLKLEGNMGAAWRWLDKDLVGWISLAAIDEESSNLLHSFKEWAESRFGSLPSFFKTVGSSTSTCALSYPELRVACRKFKWEGDAQVLFNCLTKNGDSVTLKDVAFLSNWGVYDYDNIRLLKETTDML
jgi:Ca2+-binding EF-hand superfamily protein